MKLQMTQVKEEEEEEEENSVHLNLTNEIVLSPTPPLYFLQTFAHNKFRILKLLFRGVGLSDELSNTSSLQP